VEVDPGKTISSNRQTSRNKGRRRLELDPKGWESGGASYLIKDSRRDLKKGWKGKPHTNNKRGRWIEGRYSLGNLRTATSEYVAYEARRGFGASLWWGRGGRQDQRGNLWRGVSQVRKCNAKIFPGAPGRATKDQDSRIPRADAERRMTV
jgi:hypothetical protein